MREIIDSLDNYYDFPIYKNLEELKLNYISDYSNYRNDMSFYKYLSELKTLYLFNPFQMENIDKEEYLNTGHRASTITKTFIQSTVQAMVFGLRSKTNIEIYNDIKQSYPLVEKCKDDILSLIQWNKIKLENNEKYDFRPIYDFLSNEIENEKFRLKSEAIRGFDHSITNQEPVNDYSDTSTHEKLILLDKLGVLDYLDEKLEKPGTKKHLTEILSAIIGVNAKTLNTYVTPLRNNDIYNPLNPYHAEKNEPNADKILRSFKLKNTD